MKTLKLFALTLALSLAGLVYASGSAAQSQSHSKEAAKASCCAAAAECCQAGADCCKSDKDCCAGGVCNMKEHAAHHAAQSAGQPAAARGAQHKAHAQTAGEAQSCPLDGAGCCAGKKAEGTNGEAGCCKMHADAAHAAHAQGAAAGGGEKAHASCCSMHKSGGASGAKAGESCCAGGAECCKGGESCCTAPAKPHGEQ